MLGIPVVSYFGDVLMFPRTLVREPRTQAQYSQMLDEALAEGWSGERATAFFRWAVLFLARNRIGLTGSDASGWQRHPAVRLAQRIVRRLRRNYTRLDDEDWDILTRRRRHRQTSMIYEQIDRRLDVVYDVKQACPEGDGETEAVAVRRALTRIADAFTRASGQPADRLRGVLAQGIASRAATTGTEAS